MRLIKYNNELRYLYGVELSVSDEACICIHGYYWRYGQSVATRLLEHGDCEFEFHLGHGSCHATDWSPVQGVLPTVCNAAHTRSIMLRKIVLRNISLPIHDQVNQHHTLSIMLRNMIDRVWAP
jgi:hypothetical protein